MYTGDSVSSRSSSQLPPAKGAMPKAQQKNLGKLVKLINKHDTSKELKDFDFENPSSGSMQKLISKSQNLIHQLLLEGKDKSAKKLQIKLNNALYPNAQLTDHGVTLFDIESDQQTTPSPPLFELQWKNRRELEALLEKYDINECLIVGDVNFGTPLHFALANEQFIEAINLSCCSKGKLDCSIKDCEGKTILIIAAKVLAPPNFMRNFLNNHPNQNLDAQDNSGATALHYACLYGNVKIVEMLIERGADSTIKDNLGLTPLDWVKQKTPEDLMNCLRSISLEPHRDSKAKDNTLNYIALINTKENLEALTERTSSKSFKRANPKDYSGISLMQACLDNQPNVIEYLEKLPA